MTRLFWIPALTALCLPAAGLAATTTATFGVTATVAASCTLAAGNTLAFGSYAYGTDKDATTTFTASCTTGSGYSLKLSAGLGATASFAAREMEDGANTLVYNLYTDAPGGTVWGDGSGGSAFASPTGTGSAQSFTVYGRIPGSEIVPVGSYSDTITITAEF